MTDQDPGAGRSIILHVGLPKTATTAIQRALRKMAPELASRGYLYPKSGRPRGKANLAQHNLAYELYDPAKFQVAAGGWTDVRDELQASGVPNLIISTEAFRAFLAPMVAKKISILFPDHKATVVLYVRPQWEYIESGYNQLVRFGREDKSIEAFWNDTGRRVTNYRGIIETWMEHFGRDAVRCLPFDQEIRRVGAKAHFVNQVLGLDLSVPDDAEQSNPKAGMRAISAVRFYRDQYRTQVGDPSAMAPVENVIAILRRFRAADDDTNSSFIGPDLAAEIFRCAEPANRWLAETFPGFDSPAFVNGPDFQSLRPVDGLPPLSQDEVEFCLELARKNGRTDG